MFERVKFWSSGSGAATEAPPEPNASSETLGFSADTSEGNPYTSGRQAPEDALAEAKKRTDTWRVVAGWVGVIGTAFIIGFFYLAFTAPFNLWVAEVDTFGNVLSLEPVSKVEEVPSNSKRRIMGEFISNARAVYSDKYARQAATNEVYYYVTSGVKEWYDNYQENPEHDPRNLAGQFSRTAVLRSITRLPETGNRYEIQWTETRHYNNGEDQTDLWKAYVTTTRAAPSTSDQAAVNPYGFLISDIDWSRITSVP